MMRGVSVKQYEKHPSAGNFRVLTGAEWEVFKADIKENGQRLPIFLFEGMILDGWNRYNACIENKQKPIFETLPKDTNPQFFVRSVNVYRRHLDKSERDGTIVAMREAGASTRTIAEETKTPQTTVRRVLKKSGEPNGSPEKVKGKDGKSYPVQTEKESQDDLEIPEPAPELKDDFGYLIPEKALKAFSTAKDVEKVCREIGALVKKVLDMCEAQEPGTRYLRPDVTKELAQQLKQSMIGNIAHAVCPYCDGKGCDTCKSAGWVNRSVYEGGKTQRESHSQLASRLNK